MNRSVLLNVRAYAHSFRWRSEGTAHSDMNRFLNAQGAAVLTYCHGLIQPAELDVVLLSRYEHFGNSLSLSLSLSPSLMPLQLGACDDKW